jgi:hypothetical protein
MDGNSNIVSANTKHVHKFELQQKARSILFVVVIVVPVFIATVAYLIYRDTVSDQAQPQTDATVTFNPESISQVNGSAATQEPSTEIIPPAPPSVDSSSQATGSSIANPSSGFPEGLETAVSSIESNGIKGNPYVSSKFNTSSIPDGTTISFDRSSWQNTSDSAGSIKAIVTAYGQSRSGSVTFTKSGGVWQATGYALD